MGEEEPVKPKRTYRRRSSKNTVKPEHIEALTVQVFALTAMIKQAPHWMVQDVKKEVSPWSDAGAELVNEYMPKDMMERAIGLNAGVAVAVGVGMMVFQRMQVDTELKRQRLAMRQQTQQTQTHPQEVKREQKAPTHPQEPTPMRQRSSPAGGGAAPTRPDEPLDGLNLDVGGLS